MQFFSAIGMALTDRLADDLALTDAKKDKTHTHNYAAAAPTQTNFAKTATGSVATDPNAVKRGASASAAVNSDYIK